MISDNVLHEIEDYQNYRTEYMVLRELFLASGWIISFIVLYFIDWVWVDDLKYLFILMIILTLFSTWKLSSIKMREE